MKSHLTDSEQRTHSRLAEGDEWDLDSVTPGVTVISVMEMTYKKLNMIAGDAKFNKDVRTSSGAT